jgi:hypothetical protein
MRDHGTGTAKVWTPRPPGVEGAPAPESKALRATDEALRPGGEREGNIPVGAEAR